MAAKLVKAIVAARRTIRHDGKEFGPGAEVMLPADDAASLIASGFIFDATAPEIEVGAGPKFEPAAASPVKK